MPSTSPSSPEPHAPAASRTVDPRADPRAVRRNDPHPRFLAPSSAFGDNGDMDATTTTTLPTVSARPTTVSRKPSSKKMPIALVDELRLSIGEGRETIAEAARRLERSETSVRRAVRGQGWHCQARSYKDATAPEVPARSSGGRPPRVSPEAVRAIRAAKGGDRKAVAAAHSVSARYVSKLWSGEARPRRRAGRAGRAGRLARGGAVVLKPYRRRRLDASLPVEAYRNLRRGGYSLRQRGRVVAHADAVMLLDATFVVQKSGWKRSLRERRRNVHAWVKGKVVPSAMGRTAEDAKDFARVAYDRNCGRFVRDEKVGGWHDPLVGAVAVALNSRGAFAAYCEVRR
jgi:hypothetical protein